MRDERWDFYKGILMFCIVTGHTITVLKAGVQDPVWLLIFIRTFDVPMFAFITGVFLKKSCNKHSWRENILNKIGSILVPIIIWNWIFNLLLGHPSISVKRFWFLWSIFFCCCIIILIDAIAKQRKVLRGTLFFSVVILSHTIIIDPWNIGFLFFPCVIGYYYDNILKKVKCYFNNTLILKILIILFFLCCQIFWSVEYNVWNAGCNILDTGAFFKIMFRGMIGVLGCFSMKFVFDFIFDRLPKINFLRQGGICLGMVTLEMYIVQTLFVESYGAIVIRKIISIIGFNPFWPNIYIGGFIVAPVVAFSSLVIMYKIIMFIKKIPRIGNCIFGISYLKIKRERGF